jgi:putative ABC transport system permease protein
MTEVQLLVRDRSLSRSSIRGIADEARQLLEQRGVHVRDMSVPVPGKHIHAAQIDSLLFTQGAFAFLALLLSGVLVINLVSAMLTGQVREIGVMKAIGARTSQIAGMYLGFALTLGAIACVISIPAAAWLGRLYARFTGDLLNFDVSAFAIPWWAFASQVAVGLLLPVAAAAIPVSRGCRIPVGDALRDLGIASGSQRAGFTFLEGSSVVSRPLLLSLRNTFRKRQRLALTLGTLSLGGAVYLGAIDLRASIVRSVDLVFASQKLDLSFRLAQLAPAESLVAAALRIDGVTAAEAWRGVRAAPSGANGMIGASFALVGVPTDTKMLVLPMTQGRPFNESANELVVNRRLLEDVPDLQFGRPVELIVAGTRATWTVVGISETGPTPTAYTTRDAIARVTGQSGASSVVVATSIPPGSARLNLIQRVRDAFAERGFDVASSQSRAQQRAVLEDHLLMVAGFLGNMSLLMILVGGLALASTMSLAVLERTREIGVMRAIGANHRAILTMVQVEGLVIAVLTWLCAIPLSLPMSVVLGKAFSGIMFPVPITFMPEPIGVFRWLALVIAVSITACAWPALRATRITTASALAYE